MKPSWRYGLFFLFGIGLGLLYFQLTGLPEQRISLTSTSVYTEPEPEDKSSLLDTQPQSRPTTTSPTKSVSILFGGDLMFDRNVRLLADEIGYQNLITSDLAELLQAQDLVVANLEGPITDQNSVSVGTEPGTPQNFIFTFDPQAAHWLADHNITLVNLGNNHILDFGIDGVRSTLDYLQEAGVSSFGWKSAEQGSQYNQISTIVEFQDFKVGFVNYNQFGQQPLAAAITEIEQLQDQLDYIVVFTHWGIEYEPQPNQVIQQQAYDLIEAGAHTVIGTHPHVIQPYEDYLHGRIYYSLGNFIFDQYFSPEVQQGLLVEMQLEPDPDSATPSADYQEFRVLMQPQQPIELATDSADLSH